MRVLLVEQGDLAGATSSASTKLIHGGLRYLEYYDFKLVREALRERERLIRIAPFAWTRAWTERQPLPGGDMHKARFDPFADLRRRAPFLGADLALRLGRAYGTRVRRILAGASTLDDLGACFGGTLTAREVDYLMDQEWAQTSEDVLWPGCSAISKPGTPTPKRQTRRREGVPASSIRSC